LGARLNILTTQRVGRATVLQITGLWHFADMLSEAEVEQYLRGDGFTPFTSSCEALIILCVCICALVCITINGIVYLVHHSVIMEADKVSEMFDFLFELTQLFSLVL